MLTSNTYQPTGKPSDCLSMFRLPARLDVIQTAHILGFKPHDIPILVAAGLLRPLGRPAPNGQKHFASCEIEVLSRDRAWLDKATRERERHWQIKNGTV